MLVEGICKLCEAKYNELVMRDEVVDVPVCSDDGCGF